MDEPRMLKSEISSLIMLFPLWIIKSFGLVSLGPQLHRKESDDRIG